MTRSHRFEPKGLSVTCHYRTNPSLEPQVMALAQEVATATGLVVRRGRKSVELLPPTRADKDTVIRKRAAPIRSVRYLGDDLGDLAQQRRPPQEQAHGRLQLRRRLPARPLYGQVDQRDRRRRVLLGDRKRCGTCPNPGGGLARCRSSPL
jgi:hypothetical protein